MTSCNIQKFTNVTGTTKNIQFLAPNTLYYFKFTPVNSAGSLNTTGISKIYNATLANITALTSQNITANSANISWLSSASTLNITYATQNFILPFGRNSNYDIRNLTANTTYSVSLFPINQCNLIYNTPNTTTFTTLPTIGTAVYSSYTDTSVLINWDSASSNMYSSVSILNAANSNIGITDTFYNLQYLLPNTTYSSIVILCYNSQGVENALLRQYLDPITTLGTLNNYYIDNVLSSNATVNWGGSNSTVEIKAVKAGTVTFNQANITGSNYTITTGLQPNLEYTINIIPYNSVGVSNETYRQFQSITTLARAPYLSNTYKSDTELEFYLTGGTYTCNIIGWQNQSVRFNTSNVFITNLAPNTNFTFNTYPINSADVINYTEYTTCNISTKSRVILAPITSTTPSAFTVNWLADSYDYLLIAWNSSNSDRIYNGTTQFNVSNLAPNSVYDISVTSYGIDGQGITKRTSNVTLANVATNFVLTSSNITLYNTGAYKYNNITLSDSFNNTFNCNLYSNIEYVSPQLISNRLYTTTVNPYNTCNIVNIPGTNILYLTTLATVGSSSAYNILSKTLTEIWLPGTYSYVGLSWSSSNVYNINSNLYNVTGLTPNTYYTFSVTPYNSVGIPNTSEISQNTILTLSYIDSVTYTNTTPYSTTANWYSANGYNSVLILYNLKNDANYIATSNITNQIMTSYDLLSLSPNKTYTFTVIPYNSNNIPNVIEQNSTDIVTLGIINQVNYISKTQSRIDFNWSGIYSSVNINWNSVATLSGIGVNSSTLINQNLLPVLQPNTLYSIGVTPVNSNLIPGTSNSISVTTYASLTQLSYTSNESGISLQYNSTNTYAGGRIFFNNTFVTNFIDNAYSFQNLVTATTYKIELIPYNSEIDLANGGYSYINNITTLGNYQYTTYKFINNTVESYTALGLSSLLALPEYNVSWAANNIALYNNTSGYIQLTLPVTGHYNITIAGAAGGCNTSVANTNGFGAVLSARFFVNIASEKLILVPGLKGTSTSVPGYGAGGGGATSLFRYNYILGTISPLMVAGGGGGMSLSGPGNNASSGFVFETVPATNVGNSVDTTAGCGTQNYISVNINYGQPTFSSGGILYTATGANGDIPGGFGGGGAGTFQGTGGGGGSWTGSVNSIYQSGGFGGNRNMIISSSINAAFNGYNTDNGYITITRTLYPILNVATIPVTNISWGIVTINWGAYDSSVDKIMVSWTGETSSNSGYLSSGTSYIVRNLANSPTQTYNYTFMITPFDKYNNAGTPLLGTSANSSTGNLTGTSVTIPVTGQLTASATAVTNLTNSSFNINWVSIPVSSSITYCLVTWSGNTSPRITNNIRTYAITSLAANTQYIVTVTPYNIYDIPGVPLVYTVTTLPLAFVAFTATPITNLSSNTFRINWNNGGATPFYNTLNLSVYSNVLMYNETGINNTTSFRTINNLLPNTQYSVILNAIAADGFTYTTIQTSNITHAFVDPPLSVTNIIDTGYNLSWADAGTSPTYSNVTVIIRNNANATVFTSSNVSGTSLNITGLSPFTNYSNLVYPVNTSNVITNYAISSNVTTLAGITSVFTSGLSTTGMTLNWTGNYSRLDLTRSGASVQTNVSGTSSIYTGLTVNTGYTFTLAPYDNLNNLGVTCNITLYTLPSIGTLGTCSAFTDNVVIRWSGGNFSYLNISWTGPTSGVVTNVTVSPAFIPGSFPNIPSFLGNSTYTFTLTPYNLNNVPNINSTLSTTLTTTAYLSTLSNIPGDTYSDIYYYGFYNNVTITRTGYSSGATTVMPFRMSSLTPNTTYTTSVTPTGTRGAGTVVNTTVNTLGNITSFGYSYISSNMITLNWAGTYSFANLEWTGTSVGASNNIGSSTTNITLRGLSNTGLYNFSLIPFNRVSVAGVPFTSNIQLLPFVSLSNTTNITSNSFIVNWNSGTTYDNVNASISDGTNTYTSGVVSSNTSNYQFNNLLTNTVYSIQLTPYLRAIAGFPVNTSNSTAAVINFNSPALTNNTGKTVDVNWISTSDYTTMAVYWTSSAGGSNSVLFTPGVSSYRMYDLIGMTNYTVSLYPYTPLNTVGIVVSQTITTIPAIQFATPTITNQTDQTFYVNIIAQGFVSYRVQWIDKNGVNRVQTINNMATWYMVYLLNSNSGYTVTVTPYSATFGNGTAGTAISVVGYTLPVLYTSSLQSSGSRTLTVQYTGNQSYVKVFWRLSGSGSYSSSSFTGANPYTINPSPNGLIGLTTYDIYVVPYNQEFVANSAGAVFQARTKANVSDIVITPGTDSIRIDWTVDNQYTYVYISIQLASNPTTYPAGSNGNLNKPISTFTFTAALYPILVPNTNYVIRIIPYETDIRYPGDLFIYNVTTLA